MNYSFIAVIAFVFGIAFGIVSLITREYAPESILCFFLGVIISGISAILEEIKK